MAVELIPERATVELEDRPPTLYPMLLLLSKFRVDEDLERHEEEGASTEGMSAKQIAVDLSLFFPLLARASRKAEQKIRLAAAGAMAALTPSMEAADSIKKTLEKLSRQDLSTFTISYNALHGQLLIALALSQGLLRGGGASLSVGLDDLLYGPLSRVFCFSSHKFAS